MTQPYHKRLEEFFRGLLTGECLSSDRARARISVVCEVFIESGTTIPDLNAYDGIIEAITRACGIYGIDSSDWVAILRKQKAVQIEAANTARTANEDKNADDASKMARLMDSVRAIDSGANIGDITTVPTITQRQQEIIDGALDAGGADNLNHPVTVSQLGGFVLGNVVPDAPTSVIGTPTTEAQLDAEDPFRGHDHFEGVCLSGKCRDNADKPARPVHKRPCFR